MVRKLRHHESKLLRKVDFLTYKSQDPSHREHAVRRRYMLQDPLDYTKYNQLAGSLRSLAHRLSNLAPDDPFRLSMEKTVLEKLHAMGLIKDTRSTATGLSAVEKEVTVSSFARRRLPIVMVRTGMVEHANTAVKFIEQGHVRVGTETVTDPAFLVTRNLQDFVTWVDGSKVQRQVRRYRNEEDDFDLL